MVNLIVKEYRDLLERRFQIECELSVLPQGYISQKHIKGNLYFYLQQRVSGKLVSRYLKADEAAKVTEEIALRKCHEVELPQIEHRLRELEQAARLMDKQISRELLRLKISVGMDNLDPAQRKKSFTFAKAMNAIEGIPISQAAEQEIALWQDGSKKFLSVFETMLKRYGFSTEV